jgi:hypothetical protein
MRLEIRLFCSFLGSTKTFTAMNRNNILNPTLLTEKEESSKVLDSSAAKLLRIFQFAKILKN